MGELEISRTVLCVDDEPAVLELQRMSLRGTGTVVTASNGQDALDWIAANGAPAVVVSDMSMPGMNGIEFLAKIREFSPDTTRLLLTGQADLATAIAAVNQGQVFRFLTKPFRDFELVSSVSSALELHRLVRTEKTLLEYTLKGCAQALVDLLALADPAGYGRAQRIRHRVTALTQEMGMASSWQMDIAGLLSQVGCVTLPPEVAEKLRLGQAMEGREQALVDSLPSVAIRLLAGIPRLDEVQGILQASLPDAVDAGKGDYRSRAGKILRAATELEPMLGSGEMKTGPLAAFFKRWDPLDADLVAAVKRMTEQTQVAEAIHLSGLKLGMVLAEDVRTKGGMILVARGFHVNEGLLEKITNFKKGSVLEPLYVLGNRDASRFADGGAKAS